MIMRSEITLLFLFLYSSVCIAQSQPDVRLAKSIDSLLSPQFAGNQPGVSILVAKKGQIVYEKAFGSANVELNVPMRTDLVFRLGSGTKQYTAVAILQLVDQGKIDLQDSIQKFIKGFPTNGHILTIENLLTHTSGIMDYETLDVHIPFSSRIDFPPKLIIDSLENHPLEFTPGSKFSYSNSNFFLLGYIIEIVSGKSYPEYMQDNIFTPLGLTNTYYDDETQIIPNRVNGYKKDGNNYKNADYIGMSQAYAAGALLSNVEDMFKWHVALYAYKPVKEKTLKKAFTAYKLPDGTISKYGYGWFINPTAGIHSIEHAGIIDGFRSNEMYLPDDDIFVATLFNIEDDKTLLLANTIAALALGKPLKGSVSVSDNIFNNYMGTYQMVADSKRTLVVTRENQQMYITFSPNATVPLIALTETKFTLQGVNPSATIEFIKENGQITKAIISQKGLFEWKKIK
jgi:CubicO group peptidase (beta-lactamase class C family)